MGPLYHPCDKFVRSVLLFAHFTQGPEALRLRKAQCLMRAAHGPPGLHYTGPQLGARHSSKHTLHVKHFQILPIILEGSRSLSPIIQIMTMRHRGATWLISRTWPLAPELEVLHSGRSQCAEIAGFSLIHPWIPCTRLVPKNPAEGRATTGPGAVWEEVLYGRWFGGSDGAGQGGRNSGDLWEADREGVQRIHLGVNPMKVWREGGQSSLSAVRL